MNRSAHTRPVVEEKTRWRDAELSERHRRYGFHCPALDIDFLVIEYVDATPVALIDFKLHTATRPDAEHPSHQAVAKLANAAGIPYLIVRYWKRPVAFQCYPVNARARAALAGTNPDMSEQEYVRWLHAIRKYPPPPAVILEALDAVKPEEARWSWT